MLESEYQKEIEFIFNQFPSYQKVGKIAYKPGIETMLEMDALLGHPHTQFKSIHIAGTNGKGSTSHMIASALMRTGLNVGLYTSPHLADFRERMKINGQMVPKEFVYDFIVKYKQLFLDKKASFFEITTAMAFAWFARQKIDVAVIECGLGGRLDSTNILTPVLSVITNIGLDHCEYLGFTYAEVAAEKAGIIKPGIPVVIGERGSILANETDSARSGIPLPDHAAAGTTDGTPDSYVAPVFEEKAAQCGAPIRFAEDLEATHPLLQQVDRTRMDLQGACQDKNIKTVCAALEEFCKQNGNKGMNAQIGPDMYREVKTIPDVAPETVLGAVRLRQLAAGIEHAAHDTGLRGRWEKLQEHPLVICDTGHNAHGFRLLGAQIRETLRSKRQNNAKSRLFMVFGVVADKDLHSIQAFLPRAGEQAYYLYVNASGTRALPAGELQQKMAEMGFEGEVAGEVQAGVGRALQLAGTNDFVFIGGSTFVVAEALACFDSDKIE